MRGDFPEIVPYGLCHCGCGQETKIASKSNTRDGYIKGKPRKWIPGHATRFGKDNPMPNSGKFGKDSYTWKGGRLINKRAHTNYIMIYMPDHQRSNAKGYIYEHILIAEKIFGGSLPSGSVVHHIDGNGTNNNENNLTIFQNTAEHSRLHAKLRRLENGQEKN